MPPLLWPAALNPHITYLIYIEMNKKLYILIGVVLLLVGVHFYIMNTGKEGFQSPSEPTFTMYYADWCGHCKKVKPEFQKLVDKSPHTINGQKCVVQMVSPEKEPEKAAGKKIKGFPTFLLEMPDGVTKAYDGERTTAAMLEFLNTTLGVKE